MHSNNYSRGGRYQYEGGTYRKLRGELGEARERRVKGDSDVIECIRNKDEKGTKS